MAKFFFCLMDGERELSHDEKGFEFIDLGAALRAAETVARDLLVKKALPAQEPEIRRFEITDAEGVVLSTLRFADVDLPD